MDFLLYVPAWAQFVLVGVIFSVPSVLGLLLVRYLVPVEKLRENHDVAGITFGVLGAFYGLLLAFVIVAAWERFDRADEKVQVEAVSLSELYRLAGDLNEPTRTDLRRAIKQYTETLINKTWPAMANDSYDYTKDNAAALNLWHVLGSYKPTGAQDSTIVDKSFDQLDQITDASSMRQLYYAENLPSVVWLVIYAGCVIVIGFSYFFGLRKVFAQAVMCFTFSWLLGVTILAVIELSHPYQGEDTVSDQPFHFALQEMYKLDQVAASGIGFERAEKPMPPPAVRIP